MNIVIESPMGNVGAMRLGIPYLRRNTLHITSKEVEELFSEYPAGRFACVIDHRVLRVVGVYCLKFLAVLSPTRVSLEFPTATGP